MLEKKIYNLPTKAGENICLGQLIGAATALECANITEFHCGPVIIITSNMQRALRLQKEIRQFTDLPVIHFPDWETLPYDSFSPHQNIISERLSTLYQLPHFSRGALIIPINTLMQRVCPLSFLHRHSLVIKQGQIISRDEVCKKLEYAGYRLVKQIMQHGEYAVRNELLDLYPMGSNYPYRIDFFDDIIDSLRVFNVDDQCTLKIINNINLLPAHEFPTDQTSIEIFRSRWRQIFNIEGESKHVYQQVSKGILPVGIEYWQPLFFKQQLSTLFSYFPPNTLIINYGDLRANSERFWKDINMLFQNRCVDLARPPLEPSTLWLHPNIVLNELKYWPLIKLSNNILPEKIGNINLDYQPLPELTVQPQAKVPFKLLCQFMKQFDGKIIFSVESQGRRENLQDLLASIKLYPQVISSFKETIQQTYNLMLGSSENGFIDNKRQIALICEKNLFGNQIIRHRKDTKNNINTEDIIRNLAELNIGQPVVHFEHGIGRYLGLIVLEVGGIKSEYLIISYADNTKLYVPVSSLHLISRYAIHSTEDVPLHKLGGDIWLRTRQKAAKKVRDIVAELLDIYAQRASKKGFAFKYNSKRYNSFCKRFPFETTTDQERAINEVIHDMCQPLAMDRLICGDVGFGKTEVALRAAFLAIDNGKQVAILVPTTLLAQQHYDNFRDRFANWPVHIEMLSRFRSVKEQIQILKQVNEGKIDILISTHKLLMHNLKWLNLGLLIVDEEHRFGVRHKERIKAIYSNVDILTLTATPIPRTLNMAMSGIRDLSIITSPPARRLAVKTFVREYDHSIVREAILREILRGGQIYYLYNKVENIEKIASRLSFLVPEAHISIAHGQMREYDLKRVMSDFYHCRFNILVCTTIIETGIDVPNANTIIIERADQFGLAQLHQLRGRVGRSYHQAYAWLLIPKFKEMTHDAQQRLKAISSLEDLGVGFALATHDLEIRGAGQLLGEEQSGQMETIGFTLYMELLENAIDTLKSGNEVSLEDLMSNRTEIEMHIPALLPEEFISNVNTRLSFYKRIANAKNEQRLSELKIEIIDRFGSIPDEVCNLLDIAKLRLKARKIGIRKIEVNNKGGFCEFDTCNQINMKWLINLLHTNPKQWKINNSKRLNFIIDLTDKKIRINWVKQFIDELIKNSF